MPVIKPPYRTQLNVLPVLMLRICLLSVCLSGLLLPAGGHVRATGAVSTEHTGFLSEADPESALPSGFQPDVPGSSFTRDGIRYVLKEDLTLSVSGYDEDYFSSQTIRRIYIHNSEYGIPVTSIAPYSFKNFPYWTDLYIDNNISIGAGAFLNVQFQELVIGNDSTGCNEIERYAFSGCAVSSRLIFSSNVILGDSCFRSAAIPYVFQPESATLSIGPYAFYESGYRRGLNMDSVTEIGDHAFDGSYCLEFTIPACLQSVGTDAFLSQGFRLSYAAYRIFHIAPEVTDISRFSNSGLTKESILYLDVESPLIPYCQENGIAFALTTEPAEPMTNQVITTDTCMFMITGEHSARLLDCYALDADLILDEAYTVSYLGHSYIFESVAPFAFSEKSCPMVETLILGNNIRQLEGCSLSSPNMTKLIVTKNLTVELSDTGVHAFNTCNHMVVEIPADVTAEDIRRLHLDAAPPDTSYRIARNSPVIPYFEDLDLNYTLYEDTSAEVSAATEHEMTAHTTETASAGAQASTEQEMAAHTTETASAGAQASTEQEMAAHATETASEQADSYSPSSEPYSQGDSSSPSTEPYTQAGNSVSSTEPYTQADSFENAAGQNEGDGTTSEHPNGQSKEEKPTPMNPDLPGNGSTPAQDDTQSGQEAGSSENTSEQQAQAGSSENTSEQQTQAGSSENTSEQQSQAGSSENATVQQAHTDTSGNTTGQQAHTDTSGNTIEQQATQHMAAASSTQENSMGGNTETGSSSTQKNKRPAKGSRITVKNLRYLVTGKKTVTFIGATRHTIKKLSIPASVTCQGYTFQVTKIKYRACAKYKKLKTVTIGSRVTRIDNGAFENCSALTSITFGTGVQQIGKRVLYNNKSLKKITFRSKRIKSIGKMTFRNVPKQVNILVPNAKVQTYSRLINLAK